MARRKRIEEPVNNDRWLVSYADFITLLFAFFVVMYSISSVNVGKYRVLSDTLKGTFTDEYRSIEPIQIGELSYGKEEVTPPVISSDTIAPAIILPIPSIISYEDKPVSQQTIQSIKEISQQLNSSLKDLIDNEDISIKQGDDWLELEMKSSLLFFSGEARLAREALPILGKVATIIRDSANAVQVEGFTDNNPINTARFPSNWELSAARAASVVHLLDRYGLDPNRMSAIGYGQFKPIADNSTEQGRQKNRRVVLLILADENKRRSDRLSSESDAITAPQAIELSPPPTPIETQLLNNNTPAVIEAVNNQLPITAAQDENSNSQTPSAAQVNDENITIAIDPGIVDDSEPLPSNTQIVDEFLATPDLSVFEDEFDQSQSDSEADEFLPRMEP